MKQSSWLTVNPVLARESRVRMRGWRAPALITLYVAVLGFIAWVILAGFSMNSQTFAPELGVTIFGFLGFAQFALLLFSAPGLTAGAIAGEREKQTLDLLLITRLSAFQVVVGKLGAAVSFTLLLMFAGLPVFSLLFLLGGIALEALLRTVVVYVVTVLFVGAIGLYFSSVFKRTQAAVIAAYGVSLGLIVGSLLLSLLMIELLRRPNVNPPAWPVVFGYINPVMGLAAAMGEPISDVTQLYRTALTTAQARETLWWGYSLFAMAATALLVWLTSRRIRPFTEH
ncbi:MAG TPA: ABC transporter permease subunit [Symbiobacteriaceae bacterium]|nr:ABC transporter permease subunit [Symbiobacteriaceae bacterium]